MPISTEKVKVARCDLDSCSTVRYGTEDVPPVGFFTTSERIVENEHGVTGYTVRLFACSVTHLKKVLTAELDDDELVDADEIRSYREIGPDGSTRDHQPDRPEHQPAVEQGGDTVTEGAA